MHLIWKRYSRSGAAPSWYYFVMAVGFAVLAGWALTQRDWLMMGVAIVMVIVTAAGARLMQAVFARQPRQGDDDA